MNSYVGMTVVKKKKKKNGDKMIISIKKSILFTLPAYISATDYQRTFVSW